MLKLKQITRMFTQHMTDLSRDPYSNLYSVHIHNTTDEFSYSL